VSVSPSDQREMQSGFLSRLRSAIGDTSDINHVAEWLCNNTSLDGDLWGYKDHEYQKEIANCNSHKLSIKKCSQVGLSELLVRKVLAFVNIMTNINAIYTLPSSSFAKKFVKGRFDPVINSSKIMSGNVNRDVNSTEMKQFGSSFIYINGTYGQQSDISIPASMVIQDEVDFCDQKVLTTYASRLRHAKDGGFLWKFSTPTVGGYGISESFDLSDQRMYLCKCHCGHEGAPDFYTDTVIPGFDLPMDEFRKLSVSDPSVKIKQAQMLCPKCRNPWPLSDPARRRWVAKRPSIEDHAGYHVRPWDVPFFNSMPVILAQAEGYDTHMDWVNFVLGDDYSDSDNSFVLDNLNRCTVVSPVMPSESGSASGCVLGADIGKTSWITIAKDTSKGLEVIYVEKVYEVGGTDISDRIIKLCGIYGVRRAVIDAAPDFSTAKRVVTKQPEGWAYGCYYIDTDPKKMIDISEKDGTVLHVNRTKSLNELAALSANGHLLLPKMGETKIVKDHLLALKRVDQKKKGLTDQTISTWVNTGPDHYGHSLNYCNIAATTLRNHIGVSQKTVLPSVGSVKLQNNVDTDRPNRGRLLGSESAGSPLNRSRGK